MHILRIDDADGPDPIERSRLRRLAAEADEDAAAVERVAGVFLRIARLERIRAARIRADIGGGDGP